MACVQGPVPLEECPPSMGALHTITISLQKGRPGCVLKVLSSEP